MDRSNQDPTPVEVTNKEAVPVVIQDRFSERMRASTPFLLAFIGAVSTWAAVQANRAADTAHESQLRQEIGDSIRQHGIDSVIKVTNITHTIINSERSFRAAQNEALVSLLKKNGIPVPEGLRTQVVPDSIRTRIIVDSIAKARR